MSAYSAGIILENPLKLVISLSKGYISIGIGLNDGQYQFKQRH